MSSQHVRTYVYLYCDVYACEQTLITHLPWTLPIMYLVKGRHPDASLKS